MQHTAEFSRLANGLRVVTVRRTHLHQAVIAVNVHAGARHETRATNGITHFLEHMLFRGTARHPTAAAFSERIESLGGTLTAATHGDFTLFELTVPPDVLAEAAVELGEAFVTPRFADIALEKGIVREEILEDLDEDGRDINADNLLHAEVFRGHPLAWPLTGSLSNVERFVERHLRAHLAKHYVARNMAVVVVGPRSHAVMRRAVERAFANVAAGAVVKAPPFEVMQTAMRVKTAVDPGSQTAVRLGFPTPGQRGRDARVMEMLVRVLDDGMSTPLYRRVCDEKGIAYEVGANVELFDDVGMFDVASSVAHRSLPALLGEVLAILEALCDEGPSRAEIDKLRRRSAFDLDTLEDSAHALADFYGPSELFNLRETPDDRRRRVLSVTAADIRRVARAVFDPSRASLVLVGDDDPAARRTLAAMLRGFRAQRGASSAS